MLTFVTGAATVLVMDLNQYFVERNESAEAFAERIGIASRQTIYRYRTGRRIPPNDVLVRIEQATDGAVTANDFVCAMQMRAGQEQAA